MSTVPSTNVLTGIDNFRDFGERPSRLGTIKHGYLLRCGSPDRASDEDLDKLARYGIQLVIDLRRSRERTQSPSRIPSALGCQVIEMSEAEDGTAPHLSFLSEECLSPEVLREFMLNYYQSAPFFPNHVVLFQRALQAIANGDRAILVHCAAGKDRTGIFAALIQTILGVSRSDIVDDYMVSARDARLQTILEGQVRNAVVAYGRAITSEAIAPLIGVDSAFIEASLDAIVSRCGSVDSYLSSIGVELKTTTRIQERFLV